MAGTSEAALAFKERQIRKIMLEEDLSYEHASAKYSKIMAERGRKGGATTPTKPRGFATLSRAKLTEIGRKGGSVSKRKKRA